MATCSGTVAVGNLFHRSHVSSVPNSHFPTFSPPLSTAVTIEDKNVNVQLQLIKAGRIVSTQRNVAAVLKKAAGGGGGDRPISSVDDEDGGVSLGTLKLPGNTDLAIFETLLFQWANSLCQGANLPMPMPLKVDKIPGGARIGFITIGDGETEVPVYIDCLVFPPTDSSGPIFRAIRNGARKAEAPPGESRIMRSLLGALKKSVDIASM